MKLLYFSYKAFVIRYLIKSILGIEPSFIVSKYLFIDNREELDNIELF